MAAPRPSTKTPPPTARPRGDTSTPAPSSPPDSTTRPITTGAARTHTAQAGKNRPARALAGNPPPRYPRLARRRGLEGQVLIRVAVGADGRVGATTVIESSGHRLLDDAALRAVARWRFAPAWQAGRAVAAQLTVPVIFRLEPG
ncbi:energy transducer TonB [Marichromatium bheemlicum]|uniref:Protein TonB n=1 Tax=Marichromatium bheemlicum TaxID=365339 RepID=A0ABX1I2S3_9GAMM|nr:energy transducer TonB [Marichromatium bheemlicum]NKN31663.1 energy transducer TonB [Marichromatium bheemlicum]